MLKVPSSSSRMALRRRPSNDRRTYTGRQTIVHRSTDMRLSFDGRRKKHFLRLLQDRFDIIQLPLRHWNFIYTANNLNI